MESYPWLLFKKGQDCRNQIFFNERMLAKAHHIKAILPCCSLDWLFILEELGQCCLWNPASLESVQLPSLTLETNQNIGYCILSLPPGNPDSLIVIFVRMEPIVIFCRVGDQRWTKQSVKDSCEDDTDFLTNPVCCNGKIYARNFRGNRLLVIDRNLPDRLVIHLRSIPYRDDHSNCYSAFLVESCGEIFIIYLILGGKLLLEVIGVALFKFDLLLMEWTKVESAKDRVFFVDKIAAYSYPAWNPETEGNRVFFTLTDRSIYSFHIEEKTISVTLPYRDLKSPWRSPIWLMSSRGLSTLVHGEIIQESNDGKEEINPEQIKDIVPYVEGLDEEAKETGYLCQLPLDMLSSIASCLMLYDYMNFRFLNRTCRLVAPLARIKGLARNSLPPCLMFCKKGEDKCKFMDPLKQRSYLMNNPNKSSDVRMCSSKDGWCLMVGGKDTVFLWNPFTKKIIPLPKSPYPCDMIVGCEFLSSPESSDCVLALICDDDTVNTFFDYVNVEQGTWVTRFAFTWRELKVCKHDHPVFYKEELYFLDPKGILIVFKSDDLIWEVERPCMSFHQKYLLEANGKLLAVFMGFMGKWVRIFELDLSEMVWVEVGSVGDMTLYLSRTSSFAMSATTEEMKDTICFPRFCGDNLVILFSCIEEVSSLWLECCFRGLLQHKRTIILWLD